MAKSTVKDPVRYVPLNCPICKRLIYLTHSNGITADNSEPAGGLYIELIDEGGAGKLHSCYAITGNRAAEAKTTARAVKEAELYQNKSSLPLKSLRLYIQQEVSPNKLSQSFVAYGLLLDHEPVLAGTETEHISDPDKEYSEKKEAPRVKDAELLWVMKQDGALIQVECSRRSVRFFGQFVTFKELRKIGPRRYRCGKLSVMPIALRTAVLPDTYLLTVMSEQSGIVEHRSELLLKEIRKAGGVLLNFYPEPVELNPKTGQETYARTIRFYMTTPIKQILDNPVFMQYISIKIAQFRD